MLCDDNETLMHSKSMQDGEGDVEDMLELDEYKVGLDAMEFRLDTAEDGIDEVEDRLDAVGEALDAVEDTCVAPGDLVDCEDSETLMQKKSVQVGEADV